MIYKSTLKRLFISTVIAFTIYVLGLLISIYIANNTSLIHYSIQPYFYGSRIIDLFFPLVASVPFSWYLFFLKKDQLLQYISSRTDIKNYIRKVILVNIFLSFTVIFIVNTIGVLFSVAIADINTTTKAISLSGYLGGELQTQNPVLFGLIWSFYKGLLGSLICYLGQIFSLYIGNLFVALLSPFIYVFLENFITATIKLEKFSFTTSYVLNRLSPVAMKWSNILVGILLFIIAIIIISMILRRKYDTYH